MGNAGCRSQLALYVATVTNFDWICCLLCYHLQIWKKRYLSLAIDDFSRYTRSCPKLSTRKSSPCFRFSDNNTSGYCSSRRWRLYFKLWVFVFDLAWNHRSFLSKECHNWIGSWVVGSKWCCLPNSKFSSLVNPHAGNHISPFITNLNRIIDDMVKGESEFDVISNVYVTFLLKKLRSMKLKTKKVSLMLSEMLM